MTQITCPLCGSQSYTVLFELKPIEAVTLSKCNFVQCDHCYHYFTELKGELDAESLYNEGEYELIDTRDSIFDRVMMREDRTILRRLSNFFKPANRSYLLDFGCGKGRFLNSARNAGWLVKGIETAKSRAKFGRTVYQLDVQDGYYTEGQLFEYRFEVITLFHVLEHLPHPKKLLTNLIGANLAQGGLVVIEVPQMDSWQSKIGSPYWIHFDPTRHLSHFSKENLLRFVDSIDLKVVATETFSVHLGVLGMTQSLMSRFGFRKQLIAELKYRKTARLLLSVIIVLPFAFLIEAISALFGKGGIIRVYCMDK